MELIDFAEQQGKANYDWQARVNQTTRQEANITLGFLLTGGGAALAWLISHLASEALNPALATAAAALACWLFILAAAVQIKCLAFMPAMPPANQPLNLYKPQFDTGSIREIQLHHLEAAILQNISNGQSRAHALVRIRLLTCLSPLVFFAVQLLAAWRFQ